MSDYNEDVLARLRKSVSSEMYDAIEKRIRSLEARVNELEAELGADWEDAKKMAADWQARAEKAEAALAAMTRRAEAAEYDWQAVEAALAAAKRDIEEAVKWLGRGDVLRAMVALVSKDVVPPPEARDSGEGREPKRVGKLSGSGASQEVESGLSSAAAKPSGAPSDRPPWRNSSDKAHYDAHFGIVVPGHSGWWCVKCKSFYSEQRELPSRSPPARETMKPSDASCSMFPPCPECGRDTTESNRVLLCRKCRHPADYCHCVPLKKMGKKPPAKEAEQASGAPYVIHDDGTPNKRHIMKIECMRCGKVVVGMKRAKEHQADCEAPWPKPPAKSKGEG